MSNYNPIETTIPSSTSLPNTLASPPLNHQQPALFQEASQRLPSKSSMWDKVGFPELSISQNRRTWGSRSGVSEGGGEVCSVEPRSGSRTDGPAFRGSTWNPADRSVPDPHNKQTLMSGVSVMDLRVESLPKFSQVFGTNSSRSKPPDGWMRTD